MPIIDLKNLRIARKELDELIDWLHNFPVKGTGSWDLHSLELSIDLIDDEIIRFENRREV